MIILYALCALGFIFVSFGFIALFAGPKGRGAPFVPSSRARVRSMVEMSNLKPSELMVDLGSGDGRIVIAFARAGADAHGYELNPVLVWWSRLHARVLGLSHRAHFHIGSYWKEDLSKYRVVTIYGVPSMIQPLEKKLRAELMPGARVLSNNTTFKNWTPSKSESGVFRYEVT